VTPAGQFVVLFQRVGHVLGIFRANIDRGITIAVQILNCPTWATMK
jgi:hypothetical protein